MATLVEAVAAKSRIRRKLEALGAVVVSIGVEKSGNGAGISVGVASDPQALPATQFSDGNVPVRIFLQRFARLS